MKDLKALLQNIDQLLETLPAASGERGSEGARERGSEGSSVIPTEARKEAQNGFYARRSEIRNPKSEGSPLLFAPRRRVDLLLPDLILQHADLFDL